MSSSNAYRRGLLSAFALVILWGLQPFFMRVALQSFDAYSISWARFLVSVIIFGTFLTFREGKQWLTKCKPYLLHLFIAGAFLAVNYCTFLTGIKLGGALTATILIQFGPLLLAMIGIVFFKERFSKMQILAVCIALFGFFLFYRDRVASSTEGALQEVAAMYVIIAAITWAIFCIFQKKYTPHLGVMTFNVGIFIVCSILLLPFIELGDFLSFEKVFSLQFLSVIYLGLSTALAYSALGEALRLLPASTVSLVIVTNPFVTITGVEILSLLSVTWITVTPLTQIGYIGTLLALAGVGAATALKK